MSPPVALLQDALSPEALVRFRNVLLIAAFPLAAVGARAAAAQVIRGQIVDASSQAPIPGAFVVLLDSTGTRQGAVLSGEDGAFILRAPWPGRYTLRSERIGYADMVSDTLRVAQGQTLSYRFGIGVKPIDLEGMKVKGTGRCRLSRELGSETSVVWDEVRKALSIAVWGEEERGVPYQATLWSRSRDIVSLAVLADTVHVRSGYGRSPFASESARSLGAKGFIRRLEDGSYTFYGLDARTLLSDDFLEGHCFRVQKAGRDQKGLVGLAFEPIRRNGPPDITGTLWVDRATAELRYLEFKYDKIPMAGNLPTAPFGGRVDFRPLDNGDWVVQRWWLRMPQSVGPINPANGGHPRPGAAMGLSTADARRRGLRVHEQGGEIRFIGAARTPGSTGDSELSGIVFDSTRSIPLSGANVFLTDVNRATTTDFFGRFRFDHLRAGRHRVAFTHPYADSLGLAVVPREVTVDPNHYASVTLTVPRDAACPASPDAGGVVGFVHDVQSGRPAPGVEVRMTWWDYEKGKVVLSKPKRVAHTDTTDAQGRYLLCQVPLDTQVEMAVTRGGTVDGPVVKLDLNVPGLVWHELLARHPHP